MLKALSRAAGLFAWRPEGRHAAGGRHMPIGDAGPSALSLFYIDTHHEIR